MKIIKNSYAAKMLKLIVLLFLTLPLYSQEIYQGQYKSAHNAFVNSNQTDKMYTFLQLVLFEDNNYLLHTETRLTGKSKDEFYVLDCTEHKGKWTVSDRILSLVRDSDNQSVILSFYKLTTDKLVLFTSGKKNRKIKLLKSSEELIKCTTVE